MFFFSYESDKDEDSEKGDNETEEGDETESKDGEQRPTNAPLQLHPDSNSELDDDSNNENEESGEEEEAKEEEAKEEEAEEKPSTNEDAQEFLSIFTANHYLANKNEDFLDSTKHFVANVNLGFIHLCLKHLGMNRKAKEEIARNKLKQWIVANEIERPLITKTKAGLKAYAI